MSYNRSELLVLWDLKEHGPLVRKKNGGSLLELGAARAGLGMSNYRMLIRDLEKQCIVLRTYQKPVRSTSFGDGRGNPLMRIELVDPDMWLPPKPKPIPLAVVMARETEELAERAAHEPTADDMMEALLNRVVELQTQVDRLQGVITGLSEENEQLKKQRPERKSSEHLTSRVRDVLSPEEWERLRGK